MLSGRPEPLEDLDEGAALLGVALVVTAEAGGDDVVDLGQVHCQNHR